MLNLSVLFAAFALLQAPAPSPESLVAGVGRLAAAADNDARFEVLAAMLRERNLPFAVEPFAIDRPGAGEPRRTGRNIVVTIGEGRDEIVVGAHYDASRLPDGTLSRGAVDNGASSVMLVHLAESLRSGALPVRVRVVWFDGEELGLLADREPGRQAGLAADQAPVSGRGRTVPQTDRGEQHRDGGLRHAHLWSRGRLVQVDRRAGRSQEPARSGQLRPEALLP
jgi:hypothetical protein